MSTNELLPLFPSALHPALPIATQILSTLRNLTAPGRGNDIRPAERAALVGVAALLGCEKVQSKDLVESSAQKACSVSPAHFRSALAHSRRLLKTINPDLYNSPSGSRISRSSSSPQAKSQAQASAPVTAGPSTNAVTEAEPGPSKSAAAGGTGFSTPKKKFKYSSGVDISDLVKSTHKNHSPAASSPLRHSVTPSKLRGPQALAYLGEGEHEADEDVADPADGGEGEMGLGPGDEARTPTKRVKYATQPGVDLEHVHVPVPAVISSVAKRKREDASAFFSLRPGSSPSTPTTAALFAARGERERSTEEDTRPQRRRERKEKKEKLKARRDWRYAEVVWGSDEVKKQGRDVLKKIFAELPAWLAANNRSIEEYQSSGTVSSLEEVLLTLPRDDRMEVD